MNRLLTWLEGIWNDGPWYYKVLVAIPFLLVILVAGVFLISRDEEPDPAR